MLPRLLVSLLVLIPLILSAMSRGDAPEQEITTASSDEAVSEAEPVDSTETTAESSADVRAELDQILLSESHAPGTAAHRSTPRASRSGARSTAAKPKVTTTTVKKKPKTTTTAAKKKTTTPTTAKKATPAAAPSGNSQSGIASWYEAAPSGTCAHRTLPKGTRVNVTNLGNGKRTSCVVADRGPYVDGYIIDLSKSNFTELAPLSDGIIKVTITW